MREATPVPDRTCSHDECDENAIERGVGVEVENEDTGKMSRADLCKEHYNELMRYNDWDDRQVE